MGVFMSVCAAAPQRRVVHPHLVDPAREELAVDRVTADLQRLGRGQDRADARLARDLDTVDEQPLCRSVVGGREVRPRVDGKLRRADHSLFTPPNVPPVAGREPVLEVALR